MFENHDRLDSEFAQNFFAPLRQAACAIQNSRRCPKHSDLDFAIDGVLRVLAQCRSGRDFLQQRLGLGPANWSVGHYFKSLKSKRRVKMLGGLAGALRQSITDQQWTGFADEGPMAEAAEVFAGYDLYAGDGVYLSASVHDEPTPNSKAVPTRWAVGHFYSLCLKSGGLHHLGAAGPGPFKKKEHDMHFLKRLSPPELRLGAPKGRKVVHMWDKAGIDFRQWFDWKYSGIYMVSMEKKGMKLRKLGDYSFDRELGCNVGVESDEVVGSFSGVQLRRIMYRDPVEGTEYIFITNLNTDVPPGLIAWLYRRRWDIEKVNDQFKNRLEEQKSWASNDPARRAQGLLIEIAHNLMLHLHAELRRSDAMPSHAYEDSRRAGRATASREKIGPRTIDGGGKRSIPFVLQVPQKPTQFGARFIRWLRTALHRQLHHDEAIELLAQTYAVFK